MPPPLKNSPPRHAADTESNAELVDRRHSFRDSDEAELGSCHACSRSSRLRSLVKVVMILLAATVALAVLCLTVTNSFLLHQMRLQQLPLPPSPAAPSTAAEFRAGRWPGQLASLILDTGAAPNCAGNDRRLQPCWQHQQQQQQQQQQATDEAGQKTYWTAGKLGRLQFSRDHVASPVFSLTPDGTGVQVHRGGTFAIDAQFRVKFDFGVPNIGGFVTVNGTLKFPCGDEASFLGQTLTCKVATYASLHSGDILSVQAIAALDQWFQLRTSDSGTYVRIVHLG